MKYLNPTNHNIFVKIHGNLVLVEPASEITSDISLRDSGLTLVGDTPSKPTQKPKSKTVNTNELTKTDTTKN
tara:strand:- start:2018 stop:2233 length:216 start_codon:yes stop_codon:yes gene_type:complete